MTYGLALAVVALGYVAVLALGVWVLVSHRRIARSEEVETA